MAVNQTFEDGKLPVKETESKVNRKSTGWWQWVRGRKWEKRHNRKIKFSRTFSKYICHHFLKSTLLPDERDRDIMPIKYPDESDVST